MGAPLPIVQYWHSASLPDRVAESTRSFARLNPNRPHRLFDALTAGELIAETFTARESEAFRACGHPAMQADYLRYCAIWRYGGIWSDTGFTCLRNLGALLEDSQGGELFRWLSPISDQVLMNGLFAFSAPRHPFLQLAIDVSTGLIERRWRGKVAEVTGPLVLTMIYGLNRTGSLEALLDEVQRSTHNPNPPYYLSYAETVCELIGAPERAAQACRGIRVHEPSCRDRWVHSLHDPPHRSESNHWSHVGSDIYADRLGGRLN
jgi:mannosyltransferase OCH1-like enzyme